MLSAQGKSVFKYASPLGVSPKGWKLESTVVGEPVFVIPPQANSSNAGVRVTNVEINGETRADLAVMATDQVLYLGTTKGPKFVPEAQFSFFTDGTEVFREPTGPYVEIISPQGLITIHFVWVAPKLFGFSKPSSQVKAKAMASMIFFLATL